MEELRILFLITDLGKGGAERILIDLCNKLKDKDNVQFKIGILFNKNDYKFLTDSFDVHFLNYKTFRLFKKNECKEYEKILNDFKPNIIHTNRYLAEFLSSYYVNKNIKYICHGHDNMIQLNNGTLKILSSKTLLINLLEKTWLTLKKYSKVKTTFIANSEHTLRYYKGSIPFNKRQRFELIHCGFDYNRFNNSSENKTFNNEILTLINIGSFQAKKNQQFLITVAKLLKGKNINFKLKLIGAGTDFETVKKKSAEKNLSEYVDFLGLQDLVEEQLHLSDIYVHSAYYEPFGLVILEAMASSLPVITLDGKGNRDLIEEGKNGFMIYEQDAEKFANTIIGLWSDKKKMKEMSKYANEYAKQYDIDKYVTKLLDIYQDAINLK